MVFLLRLSALNSRTDGESHEVSSGLGRSVAWDAPQKDSRYRDVEDNGNFPSRSGRQFFRIVPWLRLACSRRIVRLPDIIYDQRRRLWRLENQKMPILGRSSRNSCMMMNLMNWPNGRL